MRKQNIRACQAEMGKFQLRKRAMLLLSIALTAFLSTEGQTGNFYFSAALRDTTLLVLFSSIFSFSSFSLSFLSSKPWQPPPAGCWKEDTCTGGRGGNIFPLPCQRHQKIHFQYFSNILPYNFQYSSILFPIFFHTPVNPTKKSISRIHFTNTTVLRVRQDNIHES